MVLSEAEAETRLIVLRRERDALDRRIADLSLYLELGRRLGDGAAIRPDGELSETMNQPIVPPTIVNETYSPARTIDPSASRNGSPSATTPDTARPSRETASSTIGMSRRVEELGETVPNETGGNHTGITDGVLSEGVIARRYGRALIEAAFDALEEAGRPLHASEILAVLTSRGFSLPGHDPVAALNTRLWKRSGASGPLKRLGDAVYALADEEG